MDGPWDLVGRVVGGAGQACCDVAVPLAAVRPGKTLQIVGHLLTGPGVAANIEAFLH